MKDAGARVAAGTVLGMVALAALVGVARPDAGSDSFPDSLPGQAGTSADARAAGLGEQVAGSYIVTLRSGEPAGVAAEHERLGVTVGRVLTAALQGYIARMPAAVADRVRADPRVRAVVADRVYRAADQRTPPGVARIGGATSSARPGGGSDIDVDIAVVDTGIDLDHPDLDVAGGVNCLSDEDSFDDGRGHGTHIAGIAAARDNGVGVVGVAPGARLWSVRVLDDEGNGSLSTLTCGIDWITKQAEVIDVANMSLTGLDAEGDCEDGSLHEAICAAVEAGVTFTVAAGNNGSDAARYSPASYDEVITVSALADFDGRAGGLAEALTNCPGDDDEFASFSNFGPDVDLIAPGVCVLSAWLSGGYATLSGTSQAAAHVAGAAALYLSRNPDADPDDVRDALVRAGSTEWDGTSDPDRAPDPLLDVSAF